MHKLVFVVLLPFLSAWPWFPSTPSAVEDVKEEPPVQLAPKQSFTAEDCLAILAAADPELAAVELYEAVRPSLPSPIQARLAGLAGDCRASDDRLALVKERLSPPALLAMAKASRQGPGPSCQGWVKWLTAAANAVSIAAIIAAIIYLFRSGRRQAPDSS